MFKFKPLKDRASEIFADIVSDEIKDMDSEAFVECFNAYAEFDNLPPFKVMEQDDFIEEHFCDQSAFGACLDLLDFIDNYGRDVLQDKSWYRYDDCNGQFSFYDLDDMWEMDEEIEILSDAIITDPERMVPVVGNWIDIQKLYSEAVEEFEEEQRLFAENAEGEEE